MVWAHRRRRLVLCGAACLLVTSAVGTSRLTFDTDVLSLLPREGRAIPAFRSFLARFGSVDRLYILFTAPEGHAIGDFRQEIESWVARLRAEPSILSVDAGTVDPSRDFGWVADRQLLLLREPLLAKALARFRADGMAESLAASRQLLAVPSEEMAALVRQDPLGLFSLMREQFGDAQAGLNLGAGSDGYVTPDSRSRLVIVKPERPPYDTAFSRALFDRLQAIERDIGEARRAEAERSAAEADPDDPRPPPTVELAGGYAIALETEALVRRESIINGVGALALILPLLFVVFRSARLVIIGALPSALSLLVVLGVMGFAGMTVSAAATGASAMLFGLGVDGVVLVYVAYRLGLRENLSSDAAVAGTAGPSASMLLGMWTTAATFLGLAVIDFPSLQQLGLLIGVSMVLCGPLTLVLVPALLPAGRVRRPARSMTMPGLARWVERRQTPIVVCAAVLTVLLGTAATHLRVNPSLERLRSTTDAARLEERIANAFGLPGDTYVVLADGPDLEALLEANEDFVRRLTAEAPSTAVQAPTLLLPSQQAQGASARVVRDAQVSPAVVRARLAQSADAAGFRPGLFGPFEARLPRLVDPEQRLTHAGYVSHGFGDLIGRFITGGDGAWTLATYLFPPTPADVPAVRSLVEAGGDSLTLTGLPAVNAELAERFLPQFLRGLAIGTVVVVLIVLLAFRDWRLSLLALLPTAIGLIWTAGLLGLMGVELDLFALFAVVTFVGIGVDYGIHLVHRFREHGHAATATSELAPVILVAAAITLLGYGTLVISSYPPLRSIGLVSAVSVVALAGASVLVLPVLLARRSR